MLHREGARRGTGLQFPLKNVICIETRGRTISIFTPYGTSSRLFAHGCDPTPILSRPHTHVTKETCINCDGDAEVTLYTLEEGGQTCPVALLNATLSPFSYVNATDLIRDFFEVHPRASKP